MRLLTYFDQSSWSRIKKIVRNFSTDLSLGGLYGGVIAATEYAILNEIFDGRIRDNDTIVDVGCGNGRVIRWLVSRGVKQQIFGIEFNKDAAAYAARKLSRFSNVTIIEGDVLDNIPDSASLFYLYNPFDERVTDAFRSKLEERENLEEGTVILYFNCQHVNVFQNSPRWHTELLTLREATASMPNQLAVISAR